MAKILWFLIVLKLLTYYVNWESQEDKQHFKHLCM
jgi:hypothetical protein